MTDKQTQKKLADLPSDLIENSLNDLEKAEAHPDYAIDMAIWHRKGMPWQINKAQCLVCQSGAVMAFSLDAPFGKHLSPNHYDEDTRGKLCAINEFRVGGIADGLREMGLREAVDVDAGVDPAEGEDPRITRLRRALGEKLFWHWTPEGEIPSYEADPEAFKAYMRRMVQLFRKFGL